MPCSSPVRKASSALTVLRRATTWQMAATATLSSQSDFKGLPMERRAGVSRSRHAREHEDPRPDDAADAEGDQAGNAERSDQGLIGRLLLVVGDGLGGEDPF